ncbi:tetratricopeptide repeat protein [Komagataeibacter melomenusus]
MAVGLVLAAGLACGRARADETSPVKEEAAPPIATPSSTSPAAPQGWDFTHCTATLADDPDGARDYAEDWRSHGGGLEAEQCAALAQMELGDVATAATTLDRLAHVPDWPDGPPPEGRRGSRQVVVETPASRLRRASVAEAAARAWQADDSPKQAFDSATYGLALAPDDPALKLVYARVAVELGQPQRAIDMLTPLPSAPAARDEALVARAGAWRKLGRIDQGMADINAALHDMPHNGAALLERGILYQRQGQMELARADWLDVVRQAPDSDEADLARQDLALLETDPEAP